MKIQGTGAIVFGGASGLGAATVRRLCTEGARVVIADLDAARARELADQTGAVAVATDVTDPDSVAAAVAAAGDLRISVACAGTGTPTKLLGHGGPTLLHDFARIIQVNLLGTINTLRLAAHSMSANARTTAVNAACASPLPRSLPPTARSAKWPMPLPKEGCGADSAGRARTGAGRHPRRHGRAGFGRYAATGRPARGSTHVVGQHRSVSASTRTTRRIRSSRSTHHREPDAKWRSPPA